MPDPEVPESSIVCARLRRIAEDSRTPIHWLHLGLGAGSASAAIAFSCAAWLAASHPAVPQAFQSAFRNFGIAL